MKKLLIILGLGILMSSCEAIERDKVKRQSVDVIIDKYRVNSFNIITLEGCEFYEHSPTGNRYGLTKIDCNCVPDTTNRKHD